MNRLCIFLVLSVFTIFPLNVFAASNIVIPPTQNAATYILNVTSDMVYTVIQVDDGLTTEVITLEQQNTDKSWSTISYNSVLQELTVDTTQLSVLGVNRVRINKPPTPGALIGITVISDKFLKVD